MKRYGMLAAAAGLAAVVGGCGTSRSHVVAYGEVPMERQHVRVRYVERVSPAPAVVVAARVDEGSAEFAAQMRRRMDRVAEDVRNDVARGRVANAALEDLTRQRDYVERTMMSYTADGDLQGAERRHVEQLVDDMRNIPRRWDARRGGGPYYYQVR